MLIETIFYGDPPNFATNQMFTIFNRKRSQKCFAQHDSRVTAALMSLKVPNQLNVLLNTQN